MPGTILDVFSTNPYGVLSMSEAINLAPIQYQRIGELSLFHEINLITTDVAMEEKAGQITLLETQPRGGPAPKMKRGKRTARKIAIPHLPIEDRIYAEELQGVRPFGHNQAPSDIVTATVLDHLENCANNHEITWEWHRAGAINGVVYDADGSTVILDLFDEFGVTEQEINFALTTEATNVGNKCRAVRRHIEKNLKGDVMTGVLALCSPEFFDALISHPKVEDAYKFYIGVNPLREDVRRGFAYHSITFEEYAGEADDPDGTTHKFIPENTARFFPLGTRRSFARANAPADFIETVNTKAIPMYAKPAVDAKFQRWVDIHTQSNPLHFCTRPAVLVKGKKA